MVGQFQRGGGVHGICWTGTCWWGRVTKMIGVCEFGAEEGGMKPALELTGWDPVNEVQMTAGEAPPECTTDKKRKRLPTLSFLFLSLPSFSLPQSSCQCSRAFFDTAAAAARAQCFPDAVARPLTRSRCSRGRMMCRCRSCTPQTTYS